MLQPSTDAPSPPPASPAPAPYRGVLGNTGKAPPAVGLRRNRWLYAAAALSLLVSGNGVSGGRAVAAFNTPSPFSMGPALLAFGCAFGTGPIFDYMPAHKAATLDPVVALGAE